MEVRGVMHSSQNNGQLVGVVLPDTCSITMAWPGALNLHLPNHTYCTTDLKLLSCCIQSKDTAALHAWKTDAAGFVNK
jgi:hypothetical protein